MTTVISKKQIQIIGGDRTDFTGAISKTVVSTIGVGQIPYWGFAKTTVPAGSSVKFIISGSFDGNDYVPLDKIFLLGYVAVSADSNNLIELDIYKKNINPLVPETFISSVYGYGTVVMGPILSFYFLPGDIPEYKIVNYGTVDTTITLGVVGLLDSVYNYTFLLNKQ